MIKEYLNNVFSVLMAFIVVFSTVSFTVEKHYCGDTLIDFSIFTKAENCGMEANETIQKKSCCKDEIDLIQGQDELKLSSVEDFDFEEQQFLVAYIYSYLNSFESPSKKTNLFKAYSPPDLVKDFQVLDQVFLI